MIATTFAVVAASHEPAKTRDALLFLAGAVLGFVVSALFAFLGRDGDEESPPQQLSLWKSVHVVSIAAAVGAGAAFAYGIDGRWAWPLAAFAVTTVYVVATAAEVALTDRPRPRGAAG